MKSRNLNTRNLNRVYIDKILYENKIFATEDGQRHYLKSVLRLRIGELFQAFNQNDGEYLCKLQEINKKSLLVNIIKFLKKPDIESKTILALSIIKPDRMSEAINMAVQLGITDIIPLSAERSQSRSINSERLFKIIIEATEQSKRTNVAKLHDVTDLKNLLENFSSSKIIYANERENKENLITKIPIYAEPTLLVIGPEGGFSNLELQGLADHSHSYSVSLGTYILRAETAVAAGLAQIQAMRYQT
ncbi:MAG: RsmE family RNA methyltransferase [Janthinobacterium lividum]